MMAAALAGSSLNAQVPGAAAPALLLKGRIFEEGAAAQIDNTIEFVFSGQKWRSLYRDKKGGMVWTACFDGEKIYLHKPKEDKLIITAPGKTSAYNQHYRMVLHFMGQFVHLAPQSTKEFVWNPVYPLPGELYDMVRGGGHAWDALATVARERNPSIFASTDPEHAFLEVTSDPGQRNGRFLMARRDDQSPVPKSISRYDQEGRLLFQMELQDPKKFDALPLEIATKCRVTSYQPGTDKQLFSVMSEVTELAVLPAGKEVEFSIDPSIAGEIVDELNGITFRRFQK